MEMHGEACSTPALVFARLSQNSGFRKQVESAAGSNPERGEVSSEL